MIELYTDGASSGNPGPGGYGVILRSGNHYKELSEGFRKTTNNRMELLAVIKGLEALKNLNQDVMIYSDSKYVIDAIEKRWVYGWLQKGFAGKKIKTSGSVLSTSANGITLNLPGCAATTAIPKTSAATNWP